MSIFRIKDQYLTELSVAILGCCETLLDVGCGSNSPIRCFSDRLKYAVGVDVYEPSIERSRSVGIHTEYMVCNIMDIGLRFSPASFDCVLLSDVIEHFTKQDGEKIMEVAERLAIKRVIIFTTNGFVPQDEADGNPYQRHLSGWNVEEMKARGYSVLGIGGWKYLRKEQARFRWPPSIVSRFSKLTEYFVTPHPQHAYSLLCIKDKVRTISLTE